MLQTLAVAGLTGLATSLGAFPFFFVRRLPRRAYDGILGLGAGLMLAAATLGLLAEALEGVRGPAGFNLGQLGKVVLGFLVGVIVAALMDKVIPHRHAGGHHGHIGLDHDHGDHDEDLRRSYAIIGALSIHRVPEGLAIGAGFASGHGSHLGWLLVMSVGIQNICEGVVMGAPLRISGVRPWRALLVVAARGLAIVSDEGALAEAVDRAIAANPDVADKIRDGKVAAAGALIGAVMKEMRGQADAGRVRELILEKLS